MLSNHITDFYSPVFKIAQRIAASEIHKNPNLLNNETKKAIAVALSTLSLKYTGLSLQIEHKIIPSILNDRNTQRKVYQIFFGSMSEEIKTIISRATHLQQNINTLHPAQETHQNTSACLAGVKPGEPTQAEMCAAIQDASNSDCIAALSCSDLELVLLGEPSDVPQAGDRDGTPTTAVPSPTDFSDVPQAAGRPDTAPTAVPSSVQSFNELSSLILFNNINGAQPTPEPRATDGATNKRARKETEQLTNSKRARKETAPSQFDPNSFFI